MNRLVFTVQSFLKSCGYEPNVAVPPKTVGAVLFSRVQARPTEFYEEENVGSGCGYGTSLHSSLPDLGTDANYSNRTAGWRSYGSKEEAEVCGRAHKKELNEERGSRCNSAT